jgi:hypothetical protein
VTTTNPMTETLRDKLIRCGWVTNFNADTLVQLIERHYAALAEPEPQGPTDEELWQIWNDVDGSIPTVFRAVLARWGRPAIEPVAVQPEGRQDLTWIGVAEGLRCVLRDDSEDAIQRAWQRSRILDAVDLIEANCLPVPVAERPWEREGWCDAEGRCWWGRIEGNPGNPEWFLAGLSEIEGFYEIGDWVVLLPHHALPIPTTH